MRLAPTRLAAPKLIRLLHNKPETTLLSAQHKPRLSSMSFGLLITELHSTNLTDSVAAFRKTQGIPDSERAVLRRIATWALGVPVTLAGMGLVGLRLFGGDGEDEGND